jgi:hypothetical protein
MTYRELLNKLLDMKRVAPDKLDDKVIFLPMYPADNVMLVQNAEYNDGSIVSGSANVIKPRQFFLSEV